MEDPLLPTDGGSVRRLRVQEKQARQRRFTRNLPTLYATEGAEPPPEDDRAHVRPGDVESDGEMWFEEKMDELFDWLSGLNRTTVKRFFLIFAVALTVLGGATLALNRTQDAHDPERVYRDPLGRLIGDPWEPRMLPADSPVLEWMRAEARFWRMRTRQIEAGYGRVWPHGSRRMRNVSLSQLEDVLRGSGHRCACAWHAGVPIHALYDGGLDAFMVEPKLGEETDETRAFRVRDRGEDRMLVVPRQMWVDYAQTSGAKTLALARDASVACLIQCSEVATGTRLVDPEGRVVRARSEFDRDEKVRV